MESQPTPTTGVRATAPLPVGAFFDGELELDALERMLLAYVVHPEGAGCDAAWLLLWNPRSGLMEGWRGLPQGPAEADLDRELGRARRAAPDAQESSLQAWAEAPEALDGVLAEAWRGSTLACGPAEAASAAPWSGAERMGALALRRGARAYGLLVATWSAGRDAKAIGTRLEWLRVTADAALSAQSRAVEARRRARQAEALAEFARTCVSPVNLAEALHLLARLAAHGTHSRGSALYRVREGRALEAEVTFGPAAVRDPLAAGFAGAAAAAIASGTATLGERADDAPGLPQELAGETSVWAALPLAAYGHVHGALVVHDGLERHPSAPTFERGDAEFLAALAGQGGLLLEHARLLERVRRSEEQLGVQGDRLRDLDRLAAVGEMAARVAHEARNPLASIGAFARRAARELPEDDPRHEYLEIVVRESERLAAMLQEQREYARIERGRLRMQGLNAVVQEALQRVSETLVRRRVRLLKKLAGDLPELLLDEARIRRVVENVVTYALEAVPLGGRIRVESRRAGEWVVLEIAHDGARAGGDLLEQLFVPFTAGSPGGAAVGLGVAQQIVREHGGEIRVKGEGEWGTVFVFTLPVAGNEDRRHSGERRTVRADRRRRGKDADTGEGGVV